MIQAVATVALIGWCDYVIGREWSFFLFYAFPLAVVVRAMGRRRGFLFATFCTAVWCAANLRGSHYQTGWGFAVAGGTRLFYFAVLVVAVAAVKEQMETNAARIQALERAWGLENEILRASEREKRRISQDLHDGLGPHLAAIGYAATFLADELRERERPETEGAEQIREMAAKALSLTRGLARGIFPVQMDAAGLSVALADLARTTSEMTRMPISFYETGNTEIGDPEVAMHLFLIAQEAMSNALKHSDARSITIALSRSGNSLRLVIADDGKGMDQSKSGERSLGLRSMQYRARAVGAELKIESKPNEGTIVSCEITDSLQKPETPAS